MRHLRFPAAFLLTALAFACNGTASEAEPMGTQESRAIVTQSQADRAFVIASGIDYLPWGYTADGCYARALYMSMELAVERIPSSSQYIYATNGGELRPVGGPVWGWHVAPMVKVGATGTAMIIDPSVFAAPEVARSLDRWVTRNNPTPAADYAVALVQGSHYWKINDLVDTAPIASFAELDPFQGADIESACDVAWRYMAEESPVPSPDALTTKRASLITHTRTLITGLRAVSKLSDLDADHLSCGGHADGKAPAETDPAPAEPTTDETTEPPATEETDAGAPPAEPDPLP